MLRNETNLNVPVQQHVHIHIMIGEGIRDVSVKLVTLSVCVGVRFCLLQSIFLHDASRIHVRSKHKFTDK